MRMALSLAFILAFSWWYAAESYVGLAPSSWSEAKPYIYLSLALLLSGSVWEIVRGVRSALWLPAFAAFSVVLAHILWRGVVHGRGDFKLHAGLLADSGPLIAALGVIAVALELRHAFGSVRRET